MIASYVLYWTFFRLLGKCIANPYFFRKKNSHYKLYILDGTALYIITLNKYKNIPIKNIFHQNIQKSNLS